MKNEDEALTKLKEALLLRKQAKEVARCMLINIAKENNPKIMNKPINKLK